MRPLGLLTVALFVIAMLLLHACATQTPMKLLWQSIDEERRQAANPNPLGLQGGPHEPEPDS